MSFSNHFFKKKIHILIILLCGNGSAAGSATIREPFDSQMFDPMLFRASENDSGGQWEVTDGVLRAVLPPGRSGRPPLKFIGQFHLEGDFKVSVQYSIKSLPRPKKSKDPARNNIEIYLGRPGGFVSFFRNAEADDGYGYHVHDPKVIGKKDVYRRTKTDATYGVLEIRRIGTALHFSRGLPGGTIIELGTVEVDTRPYTQVAFQAIAYKSADGLDIILDDIEVEADRIVRLNQPGQGSHRKLLLAFITVVFAVSVAGVYYHFRRSALRTVPVDQISPRGGFTLIEILVILAIIGVLIGLLLPAVQASRESARRASCRNNLKQVGIALANHETVSRAYPFGDGGGGPPSFLPRWSLHTQLLPFLEQQSLYQALNFEGVPWGHNTRYSPANQTALSTKVATFLCPSDSDAIDDPYHLGHNSYRASAGTKPFNLLENWPAGSGRNDGSFWYLSAIRPADIRDGMATTAFFSERCLGTPGRPDLRSDYYLTAPSVSACSGATPDTAPRMTNSVQWSGGRWGDGNIFYTRYHSILTPNKASCNFDSENDYKSQAIVTASSRHGGGVHLLAADGSVRFVRDSIDQNVWKALGSIAGREVVDLD